MIIKFIVKDSKYTQIIERYLEDGGPFVLTYHTNKAEYEHFKELVKKLKNSKCYTEEYCFCKEFIEPIIYKNFTNYIEMSAKNSNWKTQRFTSQKLNDYKDVILKEIKVQVKDIIIPKPKANTEVYYIDFIRQTITI